MNSSHLSWGSTGQVSGLFSDMRYLIWRLKMYRSHENHSALYTIQITIECAEYQCANNESNEE